ncbi:MAG: hypothetical protein ACXWT0_00225 [Methylobacter sp.]
MKTKTVSGIEIEPCFEITGSDAMGVIVRQALSDDKKTPMVTIELRSDCETLGFISRAEVKAFCAFLTEIAEEHLDV